MSYQEPGLFVGGRALRPAERLFCGIRASGSGSEGIKDYLNTKFIHRRSA